MAAYKVDNGVPFLTDANGVLVGYIDDSGIERSVDGLVLDKTTLKPLAGIVVSTDAPVDADGRPDGTIYLQVA